MKLDVTNAECIKQQNNITNTTYYNICDGTQSVVGVGTADILAGMADFGLLCLMCWFCWLFYKTTSEF